MKRLKVWLEARRLRRLWPIERQLEQLRIVMESDARWMAHDPKVAALTERYLALTAPDWYRQPVKSAWHFRDTIGLNPHDKSPMAPIPRDELYRRLDVWKNAAIDFFEDAGPARPDDLNLARASVQEAVNRLYAALEQPAEPPDTSSTLRNDQDAACIRGA